MRPSHPGIYPFGESSFDDKVSSVFIYLDFCDMHDMGRQVTTTLVVYPILFTLTLVHVASRQSSWTAFPRSWCICPRPLSYRTGYRTGTHRCKPGIRVYDHCPRTHRANMQAVAKHCLVQAGLHRDIQETLIRSTPAAKDGSLSDQAKTAQSIGS